MPTKKKYQMPNASHKGFSFLEMLVAVAIFSLVMITAGNAFSRFIAVQKRTRDVQQDLEDARFSMELMAKTLRTSSIMSCNSGVNPCPPSATSVQLYDYSQEKCIRYAFQSGKIQSASAYTDKATCAGAILGGLTDIINKYVSSVNFGVVQSSQSPRRVGKATISITICSNNETCSGAQRDKATIQTTISLRDYGG